MTDGAIPIEFSTEAVALLSLMALRGVVILRHRNDGYRLAAFSTQGEATEAFPGLLGKLGFCPLDLPKPPCAEIVLAMRRAGFVSLAFEQGDPDTCVYVLSPAGFQRGLTAERDSSSASAAKPSGPARKSGSQLFAPPRTGPATVIHLGRGRALLRQRSLIERQARRMRQAQLQVEKQTLLVQSLAPDCAHCRLARDLLATMRASCAAMEKHHRLTRESHALAGQRMRVTFSNLRAAP